MNTAEADRILQRVSLALIFGVGGVSPLPIVGPPT